MKIICWIKTIYRSFDWATLMSGIYTDGCDYVEQDNGDLICEVCGRKDNP